MNKIVVRFADGKVLKGYTSDFSPNKDMFHLTGKDHQQVELVRVEKLKAVFIVKEFDGNPNHSEADDFDNSQKIYGSRMRVHFKDGEELVGVAVGYKPDKTGFFLTPCDPESNTIRAFVVNEFVDKATAE
ncbi:MAG: hypothetical protein GF388_06645 [Candidatus Aegiribacteria sp.]|nr:hypothetical protein [Candidatus Aegiribacteria sp.]MBD3294829.1 hypothetical protein [Candidatus Fermentibacteria bacterium]